MEERAAPGPLDYAVRTCEARLPRRAKRVALAGQRLPPPADRPRRIVVVGDTGCRLKAVDGFQACNDPRAWPFARVARSIARWRPDVVIQVGDYLYREEPCPQGNRGCEGSPFGQNWPTWDADFFTPAAPALRAAPWLFVRGDHELCSRAGPGWFRFLDPRPMSASCQDLTEPYSVNLAGVRMLVLDTALANDRPPRNPDPYVSQFAALRAMAGANAWLLAHKPMWGPPARLERRQCDSAQPYAPGGVEQLASARGAAGAHRAHPPGRGAWFRRRPAATDRGGHQRHPPAPADHRSARRDGCRRRESRHRHDARPPRLLHLRPPPARLGGDDPGRRWEGDSALPAARPLGRLRAATALDNQTRGGAANTPAGDNVHSGGQGLQGIRERVSAVGGRLQVGPHQGEASRCTPIFRTAT
jgi:Calcineurin-like phosphoesterase